MTREKRLAWIWIGISWLIVAFGQPSWVHWLGFCAAAFGYALFWKGYICFESKKTRFLLALGWGFCVQACQLSWMTSIEYQGFYILAVHFFLSVWLGAQFALFSLLIRPKEKMSLWQVLGISSLWVLIEWARLHILCGFSFNPSGLFLTGNFLSLQLAAVWGILGLSFWVIFTNLLFFQMIAPPSFSIAFSKKKPILAWAAVALIPYLFGILHIAYHTQKPAFSSSSHSAALVQTGLLPSEKFPLSSRLADFISPYDQWRQIIRSLKEQKKGHFDFIALPESAVPFRAEGMVYSFSFAYQILSKELGEKIDRYLPPFSPPFAELQKEEWMVSNAFWAQVIANFFNAELIAGLDAYDAQEKKNYAAAFHFTPYNPEINRYEKRILVPLAEYLPFSWLHNWVKYYGITEFFTHGKSAKVFLGKVSFSVSICYEETFSEISRENRIKGADLLINISNDGWYPFSRLPKQHFDHGRVRAVENGVPLLRACNVGVTAGIDSLGRVYSEMQNKISSKGYPRGSLVVQMPSYHYHTLYTFWGDGGIVALALGFFAIFLRKKFTNSFF